MHLFVTDEGGDGDYLHSILGMQSCYVCSSRFSFIQALLAREGRECRLISDVFWLILSLCGVVLFYDHYFVLWFFIVSLSAVHRNGVVVPLY